MKGIDNLGATCWLNALLQCLKVCRNWEQCNSTGTSSEGFKHCTGTVDKSTFKIDNRPDALFKTEFYKLIHGETENTTHFLSLMRPFENTPSDSQEALLYILDKLDIKDFEGEETQTVIYPEGKSETKTKTMFWFHQEKPDVVQGYTDSQGKTHHVAVIERKLTKVPEVLVSNTVKEELFGKQLIGIVCWGFGHYVAYVKEAGEWWYANDHYIKKANPNISGHIGFYGVGKTYTQRTHFEEA